MVLLCFGFLLGLGLGLPSPAGAEGWERDPSSDGPFRINELQARLVDPASGREVVVLLITPQLAPGEAPAPLVLFSPGFLLRGDQYRSYGQRLASHGIIAAMLTYQVSLFSADHRLLLNDLLFALDRLLAPDGPLAGRADPGRVGTAGHSLGGKLSLFAASADGRIRAVGALDPVDGGPPGGGDPARFPSVAPELMDRVHAPLLLIGAELGGVAQFGQPCAPVEENYQRFFEAALPPVIEVTQLDTGHMQYLDNPDCGLACAVCARGGAPSDQVRDAARAYLTAFFLGHLAGMAEALTWLDARLAEDEASGLIRVRRK
jgi:hypothetical protein